jgi:hypothetical protein
VTIERFDDLGHGGPISRPVAVAGSIIGLAGRIERTRAAESHLEGVS